MRLIRGIGPISAALLVALAAAWTPGLLAQDQPRRVPPAEFGEVFHAGTLENLNEGVGGAASLDLRRIIGKRPVILYYWIAGNGYSEKVFEQLQDLADELGPSSIVLYGVVTERPGLGRDRIRERIRALKIHVPVLNDEGFELGQRLAVRRVPSISILDAEGRLRLANAGSLRQTLEYNLDVEGAVRRVASGKGLGTYGSLPKWNAVKELVGEPSPDFEGPLITDPTVRRWSDLVDSRKLNVLVFWSVDCPHCRKTLPSLSEWLKANPDINMVGAAHVTNETVQTKTKEFCVSNKLAFRNFVDRDRSIADRYRVDATPTFVVVGPDGVIDSVLVSGTVDVEKALSARKKELLKASAGG